jgi:Ala-tRNA(Pro) deacylase
MSAFERVIAHLDALGIAYRLMHHAPTLTSLEAAQIRGVDASRGAKSLVVKSKDGMALFVVPGDALLDWAAVKAAGFRKPRLADDDELLAATGLTKGSVPPFGNLFGLPVFIDDDVVEVPLVQFNAASLTDSVEIAGAELVRATDGTVGRFRAQP